MGKGGERSDNHIVEALGVGLGAGDDVETLHERDEEAGLGVAVEIRPDLATPLGRAESLLDRLLKCPERVPDHLTGGLIARQ